MRWEIGSRFLATHTPLIIPRNCHSNKARDKIKVKVDPLPWATLREKNFKQWTIQWNLIRNCTDALLNQVDLMTTTIQFFHHSQNEVLAKSIISSIHINFKELQAKFCFHLLSLSNFLNQVLLQQIITNQSPFNKTMADTKI